MIYNELLPRGTRELPMELYEIDYNHPRYEMAHHWHSEFEIIRILSGKLNVRLNRRDFVAGLGDVVFVNSETVHGAHPEDCIYECIVLSTELLSAKDSECSGFITDLLEHIRVVNDHFKKSDADIIRSADSLFEVMKRGGCYFEAMGALYTLFGTIMKEKLHKSISGLSEANTAQNTKLKKALSFIRKNYANQLSLDEMASAVGMSPKYFCSFFKEMTRKSPVTYLNIYRIEVASRKIATTDTPITDIAFGCGFNDLSYFIKTFKATMGMTPRAYRKKMGVVVDV